MTFPPGFQPAPRCDRMAAVKMFVFSRDKTAHGAKILYPTSGKGHPLGLVTTARRGLRSLPAQPRKVGRALRRPPGVSCQPERLRQITGQLQPGQEGHGAKIIYHTSGKGLPLGLVTAARRGLRSLPAHPRKVGRALRCPPGVSCQPEHLRPDHRPVSTGTGRDTGKDSLPHFWQGAPARVGHDGAQRTALPTNPSAQGGAGTPLPAERVLPTGTPQARSPASFNRDRDSG